MVTLGPELPGIENGETDTNKLRLTIEGIMQSIMVDFLDAISREGKNHLFEHTISFDREHVGRKDMTTLKIPALEDEGAGNPSDIQSVPVLNSLDQAVKLRNANNHAASLENIARMVAQQEDIHHIFLALHYFIPEQIDQLGDTALDLLNRVLQSVRKSISSVKDPIERSSMTNRIDVFYNELNAINVRGDFTITDLMKQEIYFNDYPDTLGIMLYKRELFAPALQYLRKAIDLLENAYSRESDFYKKFSIVLRLSHILNVLGAAEMRSGKSISKIQPIIRASQSVHTSLNNPVEAARRSVNLDFMNLHDHPTDVYHTTLTSGNLAVNFSQIATSMEVSKNIFEVNKSHKSLIRVTLNLGILYCYEGKSLQGANLTNMSIQKYEKALVYLQNASNLCQRHNIMNDYVEILNYMSMVQAIMGSRQFALLNNEAALRILDNAVIKNKNERKVQKIIANLVSIFINFGNDIRNPEVVKQMNVKLIELFREIFSIDLYTFQHSDNTGLLLKFSGEPFIQDFKSTYPELAGISPDDLYIVGLFHDLGKMGILPSILYKPDKLTKEEQEEMQEHPMMGVRYLQRLFFFMSNFPIELIKRGISEHHRWYKGGNGKGYPASSDLLYPETHVISQLLTICDFFDALRQRRPYRATSYYPEDIFRSYVEDRESTSQEKKFNPELTSYFMELFKEPEKRDYIDSLYNRSN